MVTQRIYNLGKALFPINRSITGKGTLKSLKLIQKEIPKLKIKKIKSNSKVFDWKIPPEWNVKKAFVKDKFGKKIIDIEVNNLHLVGYSSPVEKKISKKQLLKRIYSIKKQPNAIPYVTSYYKRYWGFCLSYNQKKKIIKKYNDNDKFIVKIDSNYKKNGNLNYGEVILPGKEKKEILISTYICHPSMANNELSGPTVVTFLAKWLSNLSERYYTYRIVFIPETIGSITYLSLNYNEMKQKTISGFNVSCVGDDRSYSYIPSRDGNSISDKIALHVLNWIDPNFVKYSWLDRGSDERQYCAPGIDLPIASIIRTKYGKYPEYHTSLDDLKVVVTPKGLDGGYWAIRRAIEAIERNKNFKVSVLGEPQMGKRGLYPTLSTKKSTAEVKLMMDFISFCDGTASLLQIANKLNVAIWDLYDICDKLEEHNLLIENQ